MCIQMFICTTKTTLKAGNLCLFNAILESVSLANDICCWRKKTGIDGVMQNNAIFVFFYAKQFHKMAASIKIKNCKLFTLCVNLLLVIKKDRNLKATLIYLLFEINTHLMFIIQKLSVSTCIVYATLKLKIQTFSILRSLILALKEQGSHINSNTIFG